MTHEELLAKVDKWYGYARGSIAQVHGEFCITSDGCKCYEYDSVTDVIYKTFRAVVELHKPNDEFVDDVIVCSECYRDFYFGGEHYEYGKYPCKTIQAIEKELV